MNDREMKEVLGKGAPSTYTLDPNMKNEISRSTLDSINREVKKHLTSKKRATVVVVKE